MIQSPAEFQEGIFFKGQIYDAFRLLSEIPSDAKKSIVIIDNYADDSVLDMLSVRKNGVVASIITASPSRISKLRLEKLNAQYPQVDVLKSDEFHDRFIIIDDSKVYHVGASLKDAGKKCFAVSILADTASMVLRVKKILS